MRAPNVERAPGASVRLGVSRRAAEPGVCCRATRWSAARRLAAAALAAAAALSSGAALAQSPADSPAGLWKTIDETTKQPKALVRIVENDGVLTGRIERILPPGNPEAKCEACDDERRDQPVQGMAILTGLRRQGEQWEGGRILDPTNGKNYQARVKLIEGGRRLELRGFIGTPMLGRTQVWLREQ